MRRTLVALTLLAVVGTLAAGCGGDGSSSGGSGSSSTAGGQGGGNAVTIDNLAFSPATLNLKTVLVSLRGRRAGVKIGLAARRRRMPAWSLRP